VSEVDLIPSQAEDIALPEPCTGGNNKDWTKVRSSRGDEALQFILSENKRATLALLFLVEFNALDWIVPDIAGLYRQIEKVTQQGTLPVDRRPGHTLGLPLDLICSDVGLGDRMEQLDTEERLEVFEARFIPQQGPLVGFRFQVLGDHFVKGPMLGLRLDLMPAVLDTPANLLNGPFRQGPIADGLTNEPAIETIPDPPLIAAEIDAPSTSLFFFMVSSSFFHVDIERRGKHSPALAGPKAPDFTGTH